MKATGTGYWLVGFLLWMGIGTAMAQDFQVQTLSTLVPNVYDVSAADLDGDGDLDVAVSSSLSGMIWWVETRPGGSSTHNILSLSGNAPRKLDTGDYDGDGDVDIIVAVYGESRFVWLENLGSGTVGRFAEHTLRSPANGAWSVASADHDGDGDLDLVLTEYTGAVVRILTRVDTGWVETPFNITYPLDAKFVDLDGDGDLDVVGCTSYIPLFRIRHSGLMWTLDTLALDMQATTAVAVADFDGDGLRDVATPRFSTNYLSWWRQSASGFTEIALPGAMTRPRDIGVADFNHDLRPDIITCGQEGEIAWFERTATNFTRHALPGGFSFYGLDVVDFDQDGDMDVVVGDYGNSELLLYANQMGIPAVLEGTVRAARDGTPVADVIVTLSENGSSTITDAAGHYRIRTAGGSYTLTVRHPCWNEAQLSGVVLVRGDTVTTDFSLTRPVAAIGATSINIQTQNRVPAEAALIVGNTGDGPLTVRAIASGDYENDPWLSISPDSAVVAAGGEFAFTVRVAPDTSDAANWDYYGTITLRMNVCPDSVRRVAVVAYVLDSPDLPALPARTELWPLYPNPFNGRAVVRFTLREPGDVDVRLFDVTGREAMRVFRGFRAAGEQSVLLKADDLASGVYVLVLQSGAHTFSQKALLIR